MNRTRALFLCLLLLAAPALAQEAAPPAQELYSWPTRRGFRFALAEAGDPPAPHAEVTREGRTLRQLLGAVAKLPRGTRLSWLSSAELVERWGRGGTAFDFPPPGDQAAVREACGKVGVVLSGLPRRKSVIFFIGDGMGVAQVTLGRLGAQAKRIPYNFERFKSIGLASTRSQSHVVTDSAAGATALAAGVKTYNKAIGLDPEKRPVETILEVAHREGFATGLVTTTRITHATPACFVAKIDHRDKEKEIAAQLAARGYPEVLIGGGAKNFTPEMLEQLRKNDFAVVTDPRALEGAKGPKLAAFIAPSHVPFAIDEGTILPALTKKAVETLAAQGPFFLMIEGGRVDHACHQHDAAAALHEQLDLDAAIGWALDRAAQDPDLLVVVTADHATGDLGITENAKIEEMLAARGSSTEIAGKARPKPGKTDALAALVKEKHGFELTPEELQTIVTPVDPKDYYWSATALGHVLSRRYGVEFYDLAQQQLHLQSTWGHDGAMVGVFAFGAGAESFQGIYENTEIPRKIAAVLGVPAPGSLLQPK
ncbi:MAG: alkaline phosphatase [Planctomycetota bacterium]